jgi:hypothetical protein
VISNVKPKRMCMCCVRFTPAERTLIKLLSEHLDLSVSQVIRRAIQAYSKEHLRLNNEKQT